MNITGSIGIEFAPDGPKIVKHGSVQHLLFAVFGVEISIEDNGDEEVEEDD